MKLARLMLLSGIVCLVVITAALMIARRPSPAPAFLASAPDGTLLHVGLTGSPRVRLNTAPAALRFHPAPDGDTIALDGGGKLALLDTQRWQTRTLSSPDMLAAFVDWSPDGRWLVFQRRDPVTRDTTLAMVAVDGSSAPRRLLAGEGRMFMGWSADSAWAYAANDAGIWRVHVDTLNAEQLSGDALAINELTDTAAVWSPDHEWVYYTTPNGDLVRLRGDGSERAIYFADVYISYAAGWSPDGEWLYIEVFRGTNISNLYRMRADGSDLTQITDTPGYNRVVGWTPDGTRAIINSSRAIGESLAYFSMTPDGTQAAPLTSFALYADFFTPSLSDDWLYFTRFEWDGGASIWRVRPAGGNTEAVACCYANVVFSSFAPDGAWIVFIARDDALGYNALYRMRPDGRHLEIMAHEVGVELLEWSPDGAWLLFVGKNGLARIRYHEADVAGQSAAVADRGVSFQLWLPEVDEDWSPAMLLSLVGVGGTIGLARRWI